MILAIFGMVLLGLKLNQNTARDLLGDSNIVGDVRWAGSWGIRYVLFGDSKRVQNNLHKIRKADPTGSLNERNRITEISYCLIFEFEVEN